MKLPGWWQLLAGNLALALGIGWFALLALALRAVMWAVDILLRRPHPAPPAPSRTGEENAQRYVNLLP